MKRINLMRTATVLLSMMLGLSPSQGRHRKNLLSERIGVCTGVSNADAVKRVGGHHIELGLSDFANPEKDDARFADDLQRALACGLPTCSTNGFFPGSIKVTGPLADHQRAVQYTETALRRAHEAGIKVCVLGSAGSRNIPDGFPRQEAEAQFVELLRKLAPIARKYDIVIAIEPLQKSESNFINTVQEGYEIARKVNHPSVGVNADIFHMLREGESPQSLLNAGRRYIRNVHIAEAANRTAPGVEGDDFTPYFEALRAIKYQGNISIECGWSDFQKQVGPAIAEVKRQLQSVGF